MEIIKALCWIVQVISAVSLIILVLLQHGKGADAGATFGSGSSGSLFGASGAGNFLSRTTAIFATVFFITTFALVIFSSNVNFGDSGLMENYSKNKISPTASTKNTVNSANMNSQKDVESKAIKNQMPK